MRVSWAGWLVGGAAAGAWHRFCVPCGVDVCSGCTEVALGVVCVGNAFALCLRCGCAVFALHLRCIWAVFVLLSRFVCAAFALCSRCVLDDCATGSLAGR